MPGVLHGRSTQRHCRPDCRHTDWSSVTGVRPKAELPDPDRRPTPEEALFGLDFSLVVRRKLAILDTCAVTLQLFVLLNSGKLLQGRAELRGSLARALRISFRARFLCPGCACSLCDIAAVPCAAMVCGLQRVGQGAYAVQAVHAIVLAGPPVSLAPQSTRAPELGLCQSLRVQIQRYVASHVAYTLDASGSQNGSCVSPPV